MPSSARRLSASPRRPHGPRQDDRALSDIVGTSLLVAMTVVLASTFTAFMLQLPGPLDAPHVDLVIVLDKGASGWGTGDEQVRVLHRGGSALTDAQTSILVVVDGNHARFSGATLGSGFADGAFAIGETWRTNLTINASSTVRVTVVSDLGQGSRVLATSLFSATDCASDATGPVVASLVQSPGNVTSGTSGAIALTLVLADGCAGVDDDSPPVASYRINDGTGPTFTSLGAMTKSGTNTWTVTIPSATWSSHANSTLEYFFSGLTDLKGNGATSDVTADFIDYAPCAGDVTPPTGVLGAAPANVTMNTTGGVVVTVVASDACAGVNDGHTPTLAYRVNDGTDPSFTSAGAMTLTATHTWQGTLPDLGWLNQRGKTLEFRAGTIADTMGNTATTAISSDLIDNPCSSDSAAPTATFVQTPANVSGSTSGAVVIQATLSDACAGVDGSVTPHLHYRINDGSNPTFTDAGAMTSGTANVWNGTIPDQTWVTQSTKTLEYRVGALTDRFGNTAFSATRADLIEVTDPCVGDLTAPTGTFAQNPSDITMNTTGSVTVTLTATDDCAGVNDAVTPRIHYRVDDGTAPAYTNGGAMTPGAAHQWTYTIPDLGWLDHRGNTLQYYASGINDTKNNTGSTSVRSDLIDNACASDTSPPTASWSQVPANVTTQTTGAVTLVATASDACAGVNATMTPRLYYRLNDGTSPAFTDLGLMTSLGGNQWQAVLPDLGWSVHGGKTLQYYASPLADRFSNSGPSTTQSDLIDVIVTYTYANANTVTRGNVTNFGNAQAANGNEARLTEAPVSTSTFVTNYSVSHIASSSFSTTATRAQVLSSDNTYATDTSPSGGATLNVGFADPVGTPGAIVSVVIKAEVAIEATAAKGGLDSFLLSACMATCGTASGTLGASLNSDVIMAYNVTSAGLLHPNGNASWTVSDIAALEARVTTFKENAADGTWRVDHVYLEVVYAPTTYDAQVRFDFAAVPTGTSHVLELNYRTTGDTFTVAVWNGTAFNTRGAVLSAGSLSPWNYTLTAAEYNGGAPRIRFTDATPLGTTQGNLYLDYARVKSS